MHAPRLMLAFVVCLMAAAQTRVEPKILSIHPFSGKAGSTFQATARGNGLAGATAVVVGNAPLDVVVEGVTQEPAAAVTGRNKTPADLVTMRVNVRDGAALGRYPVRLLTKNGLTNALPLLVVDVAVTAEPPGEHNERETAIPVTSLPAAFAGKLSRRGEADLYSFRAAAGQTLTFELISGLPQIAAGGSAATVPNFDPAISIHELEASWFGPHRFKRIAFNDEPVWVFGKPTDAHLTRRFEKAGEYLLRVEAFAGQGGADYSYQLKIAPGAIPHEWPKAPSNWDERNYTRRLDSDRMNQLALRGGKTGDQKSIETYRGAAAPVPFKLPGAIEGILSAPTEVHRARFRLDAPADIAIEIETSAAAPPFFNPVVRLLNSSGEEVATNVLVGKGACTGALTKSLQAKTILPIRDTGEYVLEVRDITADWASPEFKYRVQIRPQVPHVGRVRIDTDVMNLAPGEAKTVRVVFDREEGYQGAIAIAAEGLPAGIAAIVGADFEPEIDPPPALGKRERYVPKTERAVVILSAAADALALAAPQEIRLVVRPLVDGKLGQILLAKTIPMLVISKP